MCEDIDALRCPIKNCKNKHKSLASETILKKHLKEEHNRVWCDVCLQHCATTRDELKLFTPHHLQNHLNHGDFDESGNLISSHPNCCVAFCEQFCKKRFFNDDMFAVHLKKDHYKCHVCDNQRYGHVYYSEYKNLQIHFEKSHYACIKPDCLEKSFVVFKTKDQLEDHLVSVD